VDLARVLDATSPAKALATFACSLTPDELPEEVREAAKLHLVDTLGCGLAAAGLGLGVQARTVAAAGGGAAQATVLGLPARVPAAEAALANGSLCHALDFDDTHAGALAHVTTVVAPAALAVAEARGASGADLLAALVAGTETVARIGLAASGEFHARGFHATSVCGVFGAAAAASRLLGLDEDATGSALGLAGSMAGGLFAYLDDGTATKPVHAGFAAHSGVLAAQLAAAGAEGPTSVFGARFGFYRAYVGSDDRALAAQVVDLGERWETLRVALKAYPACHYMHGVLGAATEATAHKHVDPARIEHVEVSVPPGPAVALVLEPEPEKLAPRTPYEAKFSLQYSLAWLLVYGRVGLDAYAAQAIEDPRVLALARRIGYRADASGDDGAFPGGVRIVLDDGRVLTADLRFQPGAPENPLPAAAVERKFVENSRLALDDEATHDLLAALRRVEHTADLTAVLAPLRISRRG
jgi:2-methylcitrate dehydratase PrpD